MSVSALGSDGDDPSFGLEFAAPDGTLSRGLLSATWQVHFEASGPVRSVRTFKGQRNFDGLWWSATTQTHVGFESWLEREHLMLLDFDPAVVGFSSQPFWLHWETEGVARRHAPDYFARRADGSAVVLDVRPDERIAAEDAAAFAATEEACRRVGWEYRRVGAVDPVLAANVRWLAGYRHRRCFDRARASSLVEAFTVPRRFADGVASVGERLAVRPVAFHLLWMGVLVADLDGGALCSDSMVSVRPGGRS